MKSHKKIFIEKEFWLIVFLIKILSLNLLLSSGMKGNLMGIPLSLKIFIMELKNNQEILENMNWTITS